MNLLYFMNLLLFSLHYSAYLKLHKYVLFNKVWGGFPNFLVQVNGPVSLLLQDSSNCTNFEYLVCVILINVEASEIREQHLSKYDRNTSTVVAHKDCCCCFLVYVIYLIFGKSDGKVVIQLWGGNKCVGRRRIADVQLGLLNYIFARINFVAMMNLNFIQFYYICN